MCGEHDVSAQYVTRAEGSSPHVRGARDALRQGRAHPGIIPACAGSTEKQLKVYAGERDHPRMCGEHT